MFWVPAVIVSHLTGGQDLDKFNIQLLSPFVQKMLPMKYRHTELKLIEKKISNHDKGNNEIGLNQELSELISQHNAKVSP